MISQEVIYALLPRLLHNLLLIQKRRLHVRCITSKCPVSTHAMRHAHTATGNSTSTANKPRGRRNNSQRSGVIVVPHCTPFLLPRLSHSLSLSQTHTLCTERNKINGQHTKNRENTGMLMPHFRRDGGVLDTKEVDNAVRGSQHVGLREQPIKSRYDVHPNRSSRRQTNKQSPSHAGHRSRGTPLEFRTPRRGRRWLLSRRPHKWRRFVSEK